MVAALLDLLSKFGAPLVASIAAIIALGAWWSKQNLDRRKNALEFSLTIKRHYYDAMIGLTKHIRKNLDEGHALSVTEVESIIASNSEVARDIRFVLSHWELMSIAIFDKVADEKTCFEMVGSTFTNIVDVLEEYIHHVRRSKRDERRYDYVLILHKAWTERLLRIKHSHPSRFKQFQSSGTLQSFRRTLLLDRTRW